MSARRLVVLPPVPALLARHASLQDPVAELRAACRQAVAWVLEPAPEVVAILGDPVDVERGVAQELLGEAGYAGSVEHGSVGCAAATILLLNGSARRHDKAPGHLDGRSSAFDERLAAALTGDADARSGLDVGLGDELLAAGIRTLRDLDVPQGGTRVVDYADDPYGVQYWVVRWELDAG